MPQPAANQEAAERLIRTFRSAQDDLAGRLAAILDDPSQVRQQARLRAQIRTITAMREGLEEACRDWLTTTMPEVYAAGAIKAATEAGSSFMWTAPHIESVQALADTVWSDLAGSLRGMEADTKRALRKVAEDAARQVVVEGRSVRVAADGIEAWMGENGIGTVTYRNGARHLAADYADTVARTTSANAYNEGTFTQLAGDGIEWVEVSDGPNCGWSSHDDSDKANGTIRTLEDAQEHSLSHPRCARSFSGRPDVANQAQAAQARRFTAEEQAQMAAEEAARAASATTTLTGRARASRTPRTARTARTARASQ